jgi:hypothetical protein
MVSRSQSAFMTAMALVHGAAQTMAQHYLEKQGCAKIKDMIAALRLRSYSALKMAHGTFNQKQFDAVKIKINWMCDQGLENAESYQTYISMLIGIVSEIIGELPKTSAKYKPCCRILEELECMYLYFSNRTRADRFDEAGMSLMNCFNAEFKQ